MLSGVILFFPFLPIKAVYPIFSHQYKQVFWIKSNLQSHIHHKAMAKMVFAA
jgi:hypothetical protein